MLLHVFERCRVSRSGDALNGNPTAPSMCSADPAFVAGVCNSTRSRLAALGACGGFVVRVLLRSTRRQLAGRSANGPLPELKSARVRGEHARSTALASAWRSSIKTTRRRSRGRADMDTPGTQSHSACCIKGAARVPETGSRPRPIAIMRGRELGPVCQRASTTAPKPSGCELGHSWKFSVLDSASWCPTCSANPAKGEVAGSAA